MRALLVGWGNSTPSQLAAYERIWSALGATPRSVIPDTGAGLLDPTAFGRALEPVAKVTEPTIVHLFSDNGFIGWAALLRAIDPAAKARIRGVVSDSSPGLWNVRGKRDFARRFALGMTPALSRALGLGPRERLPVATRALAAAFLGYQLAFPRAVESMLSAADVVRRLQPHVPHLYMYGGEDALVRPDDVRAWIDRQRASGIDVEAIEFTHARHVALYPADPRRYREALRAFMTNVSGDRSEAPT